jgi:hypothetical protein
MTSLRRISAIVQACCGIKSNQKGAVENQVLNSLL